MAERRTIGRFVDAELIGQGGFGSVYRASDPEHGREVAIKVIRGTLGERERRRFDRERQTMGRFGSHPNIMPIHESGYTEHGEGFLVMELAPGGSLGDRLEAGNHLGWAEAATVSAAIARAAQAAHDQGVLHRDIKPDNILIDAYDNPRLTDFGIASVASNATATTSTSATLAHAAPELLDGQPPSEAVDIYAIGSTMFALITGSAPFERDGENSVTALIARTVTETPPDLRTWGVPDRVAAVVAKSLAKEPHQRQATASQLAEELTDAISGSGSGSSGAIPAVIPPLGGAGPETVAVNAGPGAPSGPIGSTGSGSGTGGPPPPPGPGTTSPFDAAATIVHQVPPGGTSPGTSGTVPGTAGTAGTTPGVAGSSGGAASSVPDPSVPRFPGSSGQAAASAGAGTGDDGGGGNGSRWLLIGAAVLLVLAGAGIALASLAGSDDGDDVDTAATSSTDEAGDDDTTTSSESTSTTEAGDDDTTTSSETTTTTSTTSSTTTSTTSTTTTTTTTSTTQPPTSETAPPLIPGCGTRVVEAQTARFDIEVCAAPNGALTYKGDNRTNEDNIELPACFDGNGLFVSQNAGFTYFIDTANRVLQVTDPGGALIVDQDFLAPAITNFSVTMARCA